jgi:hypothetical protein
MKKPTVKKPKIISERTALIARGLFALSAHHYAKAAAAEAELSEFLGFKDAFCDCGYICDAVIENTDFDRALSRDGFVVRKAGRRKARP